jgi:cytochrome c
MAAAFVTAATPLGATHAVPPLTDDEAYDVAVFVNSRDRPK